MKSKKTITTNTNNKSKNSNKKINKTYNSKTTISNKIQGEIWDIEPILLGKNFDTWIKEINSKVEQFKKYRTILNDKITPQKVLEIIKADEEISTNIGRVNAYYSLKFCANTKDPDALSKTGLLSNIVADISNNMMFFGLWFMHLEDNTANKLLASKELKPYKYHLENIRRDKPYTKSEEIEQIIHLKDITGGDASAEIYSIITNNYTFEWFTKKISKEEILKHVHGEDPKLREKAYNLVLEKYKEDSLVLSQIYKNIVTDWCTDGIKIRKHVSSINIRNNSYDVSDKSVDTLLNSVRKNAKIFHEYFKLKHELNKKNGQKYPFSRYHLYAPFITKNKKSYEYNECKKYVLETYNKFDKRFYDAAVKIFADKHVHSHPTASKRGGAFCMDVTRELSPYIMLNHTDTLRDMFTMMHELGHGIHDIFASKNQTEIEKHASLTICETASVFSEMMLAERISKESINTEEKKQILLELLDNQFATILRQAYFVIFEKYAHEEILKGATKETLDEKYYSLLKEQFGDMQIPEVFKHEWNYIPHIHESPFYCYSYAWGNLFVLSLYDMYKKEGKSFIEKYIELLSAGGSDSPANLMKKLGVNPEDEGFWQRGFNIIREEVEELKKLK